MTDTTAPSTGDDTTVDASRQAEIDALAAELTGAAPAAKPKRSRRVTAATPVVAETEPVADEADAPAAAVADEVVAEPTADADAETGGESAPAEDGAADESSETGGSRSRSRRGRNRNRGDRPAPAEGETEAAQPAEGEEDRGNRNRNRNRSRGGRFGDEGEPEILPDDVLIPIAGILDVLDNYAFVRTTGYLPGVTDVYVSLGQVKKYGLRKGDAVVGAVRQPRDGEQPGRQKYNALVKVDSINGQAAAEGAERVDFDLLTPVRPGANGIGRRELLIGATGAGKTQRIAALAAQTAEQRPDAHLMVILAGARPEEVTEFRRSVKGEVIVAGLDLGVEDVVTVIELAVERAKRLVELGIEVVVLIDSLTQVARAFAAHAAGSRSADDPSVLIGVKRLFGAARTLEDAASLTIVGTASKDTALDALVVTELSSLANSVHAL